MPFVISSGRLASVERAPTPAFPLAVHLGDGVLRDYADIWRKQPNVRTVVGFLSRNIAQLGLHVFRRVSDVDRERLTDHPLARLLGQPNPDTTRYRWVESVISDLAIYDNSVTVKVQFKGQPAGLVRVDPRKVTLLGEDPFRADGYRVHGNKGYRDLPADQVLHFRGYNAEDPRWGSSPIEALRGILLEEHQAQRHREQMWRNGGRFSGYITRPAPPEAPQWSDSARQRFKASWQAQYAGEGPQAGGTPILEDGMEFVPASTSARDAQYVEARRLSREEVAAAYHIAPPMIGLLDNANYSNVEAFHKQLYTDTLGPSLVMICEEIALQLLPDFGDTDGVYVEFNLAEKLRGSFEEQATQLQTSVGAPYMTRNEARARMNLPQIDGGDDLVTPLNVVVGGQASPTDSAPDDQVGVTA